MSEIAILEAFSRMPDHRRKQGTRHSLQLSYSTIRRRLLGLDYEDYSCRLANFFEIKPLAEETLALDGKVLRVSYLLSEENPYCESHKAIT